MLQWLFGKKKEEPKPEEPKKKSKTKAEQQTEDKWQYEFLVQFLNSPLWRVSILDFVDHNCVVFDNQQQNKFEYTKIHNQFKELVGSLFDGMMKEIGLDDDKLVQLLEKGFESKQKKLFNQLLLCDDFLKFKQLMLKRNKALQEEALKAMQGERRTSRIQKERTVVHGSIKQQQDRKKKLQQQEQQILRKVLQMSRVEEEQRKQIQTLAKQAEQEQIRKTQSYQSQLKQKKARQEAAKVQAQRKQEQKEKARVEQQKIKAQNQSKLKKSERPKNLQPIQTQKASNLSNLPPLKSTVHKRQVQTFEKKEQVQQTHAIEEKKIQETKQQVKTESSEERKKRLLEQRQKIRKKKEQERKKMLQQQEGQNKKVMNIVLQDEGIHDSVRPNQNQADQKVSKDEIERRKQIMKKIKNRIVDDF